MRKKTSIFMLVGSLIVFTFLFESSAVAFDTPKPNSLFPKKKSTESQGDAVPDTKTAIRLATEIWVSKYGAETAAKYKPYIAELKGDVWYVHGSQAVGQKGGIFGVELNKKNGKVRGIVQPN